MFTKIFPALLLQVYIYANCDQITVVCVVCMWRRKIAVTVYHICTMQECNRAGFCKVTQHIPHTCSYYCNLTNHPFGFINTYLL